MRIGDQSAYKSGISSRFWDLDPARPEGGRERLARRSGKGSKCSGPIDDRVLPPADHLWRRATLFCPIAGQTLRRGTPIRVIPNKQEMQFDVRERRGELFAAELEALAAIIRSRVIWAKLIGEESN
jgi:hypothetical protein